MTDRPIPEDVSAAAGALAIAMQDLVNAVDAWGQVNGLPREVARYRAVGLFMDWE